MIGMIKYDVILMAGPPGVGKGTQGRLLADGPGYDHVSIGDEVRNVNPDTEIGASIMACHRDRDYSRMDGLVMELLDQVTEERISYGFYDPERDYLLVDSFPRNERQLDLLSEWANVRQVFHLYCNDDELLMERMKGRGNDARPLDSDEYRSRHRIRMFRTHTLPVMCHYHRLGVASAIDGSTDIETVHEQILQRIARKPAEPELNWPAGPVQPEYAEHAIAL